MRRLSQFLHHRSLTFSLIGLLFALFGIMFLPELPEHTYRLQRHGAAFLTQAAIAAALGLLYCAFNLWILLRDNRSGYPSFRCSLATLLWAFACTPVLVLSAAVVREFWR
jgi:hypothetical protein